MWSFRLGIGCGSPATVRGSGLRPAWGPTPFTDQSVSSCGWSNRKLRHTLLPSGPSCSRRSAPLSVVGPPLSIGEITHHANLFTMIIGETSTGAKGTADGVVDRFMNELDPLFYERHVVSGFGSGEAAIEPFRDLTPLEREKNEVPREKRRVIDEPEFSRVLRVAHRDGSILGQVIRQGFDYKPIQHRTQKGGEESPLDTTSRLSEPSPRRSYGPRRTIWTSTMAF